ncbi:MAG: radical SAM protein [Nitrospiraceae bacterium]|nr:MAG: radical SAM protein [Nitrospiraceae bacterium]
MILIHPPVAKPSEPPAGIARLSGALTSHGIDHAAIDANLEALLFFRDRTHDQSLIKYGKWTARSLHNISNNFKSVKDINTYKNIDRYKRAVIDLNHAIEVRGNNGASPGITSYRHKELSPLKSADLLKAAEYPDVNPYFPYFSRRLTRLIHDCDPRFVGFSLNYLTQALSTFAMTGFLRQRFPYLQIIIGGGLVTSWMRNPDWHNPFKGLIDYLVAGPGEKQLLDILGVRHVEDTHTVPDYTSFPLHEYLSPGIVLPYSASSGCYWSNCSFCPEKAENNPYVPFRADHVISDLNVLNAASGPHLIHLVDNAINASLLKKLSGHSVNTPWYGFVRISELLSDPDFCMDLRKSGCIMLKLGLESGDQRVLDALQKGIEVSTASRVLKTLKKTGISAYVYLIFGTPAETEREAEKTLDFVIAHNREIDFLNVAMFNMPVSGPDVSKYKTRKFYDGDLTLYTDFEHPAAWSRKKVRYFLDNKFKRNKAVSCILRRDPPFFTSNHAPFFVMKRKLRVF